MSLREQRAKQRPSKAQRLDIRVGHDPETEAAGTLSDMVEQNNEFLLKLAENVNTLLRAQAELQKAQNDALVRISQNLESFVKTVKPQDIRVPDVHMPEIVIERPERQYEIEINGDTATVRASDA